jgi:hypothetical protein
MIQLAATTLPHQSDITTWIQIAANIMYLVQIMDVRIANKQMFVDIIQNERR